MYDYEYAFRWEFWMMEIYETFYWNYDYFFYIENSQ